MEEPLESTYAFCEVCDSICVGDFYKTERFLHHYICRNADKDGVRHTFAILTAEGVTALKNKQTKEAEEALNILKSQQRTKYAAAILGASAAVIFIKEGIEILKKHDSHHHSGGHASEGDNGNKLEGHHDTSHASHGHGVPHDGDVHGEGIIDSILKTITDALHHITHFK